MAGWGEANHAIGKIRFLADTHAALTTALGLQVRNDSVFCSLTADASHCRHLSHVGLRRPASKYNTFVMPLQVPVEPLGGGLRTKRFSLVVDG
eukprot:2455769-Pyramimonas_sp.AAC.1